MDNIVVISDSESDSDYSNDSDTHEEREEVIYENTHFMNHVETEEYKKNRNALFTKDIYTIDLIVDSYVASVKNNYIFDLQITYKNIIGIELIKSTIIQHGSTVSFKLVDIIVPEIPYKACIQNINGAHIIDRIPTNATVDYIVEHEPDLSYKKGYFFPISLNKLSILLSYSSFKKFKEKLDPRKYNGAILIGLQSPVVKSHGSTDATGFAHSINVCNKIVKGDLIKKIESNLITVDA